MKNKKRVIATALAALLLVVGGTFTYAYFTDAKEETNVITMGNVSIELTEPKFSENTQQTNAMVNVKPNQKIVKDPTITLADGSNAAYVRVKVTYTGELADAQYSELEAGIKFKDGWTKGTDGYYYFNKALTQTDKEVIAFDEVVIPEQWGDEVANKKFNIVVKAEAIQSDNFIPTMDGTNIVGWADSKGNAITAK
ncbi:MAG: TasA family protein [Coprobacillus sp.]